MMDFSQLHRVADIAGCQATIRATEADFHVAEQLPFTPEGVGSHVWLYVQKIGTNTDWLSQQIARFANVSPVAVGYAGLKDRHAVTCQWFSVNLQGLPEPDWSQIEGPELTILKKVRHSKKLKRGALGGNQFKLRLTQIQGDKALWQANLERVAKYGVPNYFAEQRFGRQGLNLVKANDWFNGGPAPQKKNQRSMIISAARSWLYNLVLSERIKQQNWNQALAGDIMLLSGTRASYFLAEAADDVIEKRLLEMDIHPTGPLWGKGEAPNKLQSLALENEVLADWSQWQTSLEGLGLSHERRALRLFPENFTWEFSDDDSLTIAFDLPPGSYATAVLRELALITDASGSKTDI
ncbi:tRNA pseudouridine(13) synthase TruD [Methylophaga sp. OBS3]|uniref:tRNA pseudouridine(13) synthase TruD n=1 Tax=Methylophaga sp. OBS3 TaxID=2991934 RepID=UPI0022546BB9|nr:tRNA pseudouridine(13) synthase TruD [Methylophaga sp. OBS3]MCX4189143.1 tRNA pseudouridine(13) synthase TruD [Methylophaga sp. OBS3]